MAKIEKRRKALPGVLRARVYCSSGKIVVDHEPNTPGDELLISTVRRLGYGVRVESR